MLVIQQEKQQPMQFTISGIAHYLGGREGGIAAFQAGHPVGTTLLLRLNGQTHPYPGSISAMTEDFEDVGSVSAEDIYRVRTLFGDLREGGCAEATIVRHLRKAILMEVGAVDDSQLTPTMKHLDPMMGEHCLEYTPQEHKAQVAGSHLEQLLARDPSDARVEQSLRAYVGSCCYSLAADDLYQRRRISLRLLALDEQLSPEVRELSNQLYEDINDFKWEGNIYKVYQAQMADILAHNAPLPLPTTDIEARRTRLHQLIDEASDGCFTRYADNRPAFIKHLFYCMPDRPTLYLTYSRLCLYDQLQSVSAQRADANANANANTQQTLAEELDSILNHLFAHTPETIGVVYRERRGVKIQTQVSLQQAALQSLCLHLKNDWQEEIESYIATKKHPSNALFCASLPYLLLGWLRRKTQLFGCLPKKDMARILFQREGCTCSMTSLETYISKADNDQLVYDDYPLMLQIRSWMMQKHPDLWQG